MDKLNVRTLSTSEELEHYTEVVRSYSGVKLPKRYVANSKVVGFFLHEKLVAGYMLVTKPEFRSLMFIPDEVKSSHDFFKNDKFEMMEVNGLWVGSSVRNPKHRMQIWTKLVLDIFFCRKKYLLLMSNSKNKVVQSMHSYLKPTELYEGAPMLMAGDATHEKVRITFANRWQCLLNLPRFWSDMKSRERRLSALFKQRLLART
ncbi:MAG: hypothetical protein MI746_14435 [Pseudomonadales bacterium]|nr:hypothetical protein [Pseudomonadales bacterium]